MASRPMIVGSTSGPEPPFPHHMEGKVISGFGRGSKELGIPTANLPVDAAVTPWIADARSGVYFGWAALRLPGSHPDAPRLADGGRNASDFALFPMVMSIGYNPFYKNTVRSAEVHVLSKFAADFYGVDMRLLILGFIREEKNYEGVEALIEDIKLDCTVARNSLDRAAWTPRGQESKAGPGTLDAAWLLRPDGKPSLITSAGLGLLGVVLAVSLYFAASMLW